MTLLSVYLFEDSSYNKYIRNIQGMNNELIADEDFRRFPCASTQYTELVSLKYLQSWSLQSHLIVAFGFVLL